MSNLQNFATINSEFFPKCRILKISQITVVFNVGGALSRCISHWRNKLIGRFDRDSKTMWLLIVGSLVPVEVIAG
jgi:hypothetical protein